jgi:DNA-binding FadR family transcriptional regulator
VRGDFPPGSLLPRKEELLAWLDVSHVTLRETLQTLSAKGMITARTRVGTRVLDEAHWNMFDADLLSWRLEIGLPAPLLGSLLEIRQSFEPLAAALAAVRRTPADLERLGRLLDIMRDGAGRTGAFVEADVTFHRLILEMSGNPFMASLSALVSAALAVSFGVSAPAEDPRLARLAHGQHAAILDAIADGDSQRASDAMAVVIAQGWLNYSGQQPDPIATVGLRAFPVPKPVARVRPPARRRPARV